MPDMSGSLEVQHNDVGTVLGGRAQGGAARRGRGDLVTTHGLKTVKFHRPKTLKIKGLAGKVTAYPAEQAHAKSQVCVRRSSASITTGQISTS